MSRMLAIIAAVCLSLSAVFLGLAYVIGGEAVFHDPHSLEGIRPLIDLATHKEWHWTGGDSLAVNAPVNLRYEPKGKPNVTVTGPAGMVEHVQFTDGRIATDSVVTTPSSGAATVSRDVPPPSACCASTADRASASALRAAATCDCVARCCAAICSAPAPRPRC